MYVDYVQWLKVLVWAPSRFIIIYEVGRCVCVCKKSVWWDVNGLAAAWGNSGAS